MFKSLTNFDAGPGGKDAALYVRQGCLTLQRRRGRVALPAVHLQLLISRTWKDSAPMTKVVAMVASRTISDCMICAHGMGVLNTKTQQAKWWVMNQFW